ncbi:uncharacterized protein LOC143913881 [Arctopsyche grandis]|uniref:uncharacterized protein LOC143913881 n=1 Tax=Arctopsyche grandis TaxID=121162 RepID=UPI00406D9E75
MDSPAEFWREPNSNAATVSGSPPMQVLKDSINTNNNNDRTGNGRRSSDGGPPPFNRTRSFKSKQLVRSQAIRESQSPPRGPSPRPDSKEIKMSTVKMKSASVDLDDRLSFENNVHNSPKQQQQDASSDSDETAPQNNPENMPNDAISLTDSDSFKTINLSCNNKNILVSTSGDKNLLGANVVSTPSSPSECKSNNDTVNGTKNENSNEAKSKQDDKTTSSPIPVETDDENCEAASSNSVPYNDKCPSARDDDSRSVDIDSNKVLDYSENNNDNECLSLDVRTEVTDHHHHHHPTTYTTAQNQSTYDTEDSPKEYQDESDSKNSDTVTKNQRVSLKNLKNSNFIQNRDLTSPVTIYDNVTYKNKNKVEFHQVEIQVTSGDNKYTNVLSTNKNEHECQIDNIDFNIHCDCGIGPSLDEDEIDPEELSDVQNHDNEERRAVFPSKQDSGVCCWDSYCGDISPEIITSDNEDEPGKIRRQKTISENEHQHCYTNEGCRCSEKGEKWVNRRNGGMLTVQRANSGGNPRLLRKQSSGGSVDSGQHSIASPFLSRDNSMDIFVSNPCCDPRNLSSFIKDTLNKSQKDRITLLKIEHDMITFIRDPTRREHRFPSTSSYGRLLVHRCADLFGLRHGVDPATRHIVHVVKLPIVGVSYRLPLICPFQQWCTTDFAPSPVAFCETIPQAKSILKRDTQSLDEESVLPAPAPPKLVQTPRSKSFEQREEEYVKARRRIFSSPGQEESEIAWDWEENREHIDEPEMCTPRILVPDSSSKSGRLLKVQSLEHETVPTSIRGVVSKAHSFGGYGGRQGVQRGDSITSTSSAPPHRILSRQGELASTCWRLSPSSSGYKTLSGRSDSVTPSPTSTPNTTTVESATGNRNPDLKPPDNNAPNVVGGVLWAITDMSTVPTGAVIIHPQTGQALTNNDGTLYHYDPEKPPHSALQSQIPPENVREANNFERRRCRLEKQRATLSPGTETHLNPMVETKTYDQTAHTDENKSSKSETHNSDNSDNPNNSTINVDAQEGKSSTSEAPRSPIPTSNQKPLLVTVKNTQIGKPNNVDFNDNNECHSSINNNRSNEPAQNPSATTPSQQIKAVIDTCNATVKTDPKVANMSPIQLDHFERLEEHFGKIMTCTEFESNIIERQFEEFAPPYPDEQDPHYYGALIQGHPQQYFAQGHIYDGSPQEVYPAQAQPLNYAVRQNDTPVPQHQLTHPHLIFAPQADSNIGFPSSGELCYPTSPAQVMIPPPAYRLHEQEPQPPYHMLSASEQHQQSVMVALSNKLAEHEMAPQQLASFPLGYHPQVERVITAPPMVGVPAPHPTLGYQIQGASGWGCWPQVALYHQPQPPSEDAMHKFQQHAGAFIPQHPESPLNAPSVPALPQAFYPHPNFIQPQPNQYFPPYSHPAPIIQHQFPVYQQYNPGRSSVLSQEGCSTPSFQNFEQHFNFPKPSDNVYQENRSRAHVNSPKTNSRADSNSGSSRTTPLTSNIPVQGEVNFPNIDQISMNNIHFIHPAINYIPISYPYANPTEFNCENQNRQNVVDNQNFIKYNKQVFKETEKFTPSKNISKHNSPLVKNYQSSHSLDGYPQKQIVNQSEKTNENTYLKNVGNVAALDLKNFNRNKDKRKPLKPSNSLGSNDLDVNFEQEKIILARNYHMQLNQNKQAYDRNNRHDNTRKSHYQTLASNLSNDAKTFIPKNQNAWNAKEISIQHGDEAAHLSGNDAQPDSRSSWRKNQSFVQKDYHNFPKNLNRQNHRNTAQNGGQFERDKNAQRNHQFRERFSIQNNVNQRVKSQPSFDATQSPLQLTPTLLNSPSTPWNPHAPQTPSNLYNAQNTSTSGSPAHVFPSTNLNQPPPSLMQQHHLRRLSQDSLASSTPNTPSANPKSNQNKQHEICVATQPRFLDANIVSIPLTQGAAFYQRTQALQNLAAASGGLGLMPTPPHPGYLLRQFGNIYQVPGALFRRPATPALFGPAPPLSGQIRARPPRPHQSHNRHFYH